MILLLQVQAFQPLLHYNCSMHLRLFVCSVFVPLCSEHVPGAVPACRDLCETVRQDCQPVLDQFLLPWPPELECSRFPASPALCMNYPNHQIMYNVGSTAPVEVAPTNNSNTNAIGSVMSNKILSWGTSLPKEERTFSHCPPRFAQVDETCTPRCSEDAYYRFEDKNYTKTWLIICSSVCLILTSVGLLTFWLNKNRFRYPERPLHFMTLCCCIYSGLILVRSIVDEKFVICTNTYLVTRSSDNSLCAVSAFILHNLELCIRSWWMIFCVCWYLHASCEWSHESLMKMSSLFQALVYGLSGIPALLALTTGHFGADELTGSCRIKEESSIWYIVAPHLVYLFIGILFSLAAGAALIRVKTSLKESGRCIKKLERLMLRLTVFTLLYLIPELIYIICTVYESWHRPWWKSLALLSALDCRNCSPEPIYDSAALQVVLLRIFSNFMIVLCCIMWVCSGKTWRTWIKVCESPIKNAGQKPVPITRV